MIKQNGTPVGEKRDGRAAAERGARKEPGGALPFAAQSAATPASRASYASAFGKTPVLSKAGMKLSLAAAPSCQK